MRKLWLFSKGDPAPRPAHYRRLAPSTKRPPRFIIETVSLLSYTVAELERTEFIQHVPDHRRAMELVRKTGKAHYFSTPIGRVVRVIP